jgi:lipopolysaccharide export system protein LptA
MWANNGDYDLTTATLVLTGSPLIKRGENILKGRKITVNVDTSGAVVDRPQGQIIQQSSSAQVMADSTDAKRQNGKLPDRCPISNQPPKTLELSP